ncbi:hypothetical protein GCM10007862_07100 [Dyella lipolytica]|uniref:Transcriptional activator TraM n=1 Tax=Dyella lipolytica TaxID=1867835 RepID=A0ABW8IYE1_9GAMM|nr:hypothetical protein [Dyella lipolytica]GLQ45659.1 hypothetical protein GCM10007862_07100 [Dyella lipolytica]
MAISNVEHEKVNALVARLKQIISRNQEPNEGEYVAQAIEEIDPNAPTLTQAILSFKGSDYIPSAARDRVRGLLQVYRDQLMAEELVRSQATLAQSTDMLARRTLIATWVGVVVAIVGTGIAIIQLMEG